MAAVQAVTGQGGTGHQRQAEHHEDIDVEGHGIEERAVVIADRRAGRAIHRQGAGAVEQLVPGVAQGQAGRHQRAYAQQQEATQAEGFADAVDVLPEEHGPQGRHADDSRPGHAGPEHLALRRLGCQLQARGRQPPDDAQVQDDKALTPGEMPLTADPARHEHHAHGHQQGQQHRAVQAPAAGQASVQRRTPERAAGRGEGFGEDC
ncbi:hypothetical protein FQZ97_973900 [compost metagenome]